jgi:hypothetical protein
MGKAFGLRDRVRPARHTMLTCPNRNAGAARRESFAPAFLTLKKGKDDAILNILRGEKFQRATDAAYADIRGIAAELKML